MNDEPEENPGRKHDHVEDRKEVANAIDHAATANGSPACDACDLVMATEQRRLPVFHRNRHDGIVQHRVGPPSADEANIAKISAAVGFERGDLLQVVRCNRPVPLHPPLPPVGHGVGRDDVDQACPLPVPAPPTRRSEDTTDPASTTPVGARAGRPRFP